MRQVEHSFSTGCSNDLILICGNDSQTSCSDVICWFGGTVGRKDVDKLGLLLSLVVVPLTGSYLRFAVRLGKIQEQFNHKEKKSSCIQDPAAHSKDSLQLLAQCLRPGKNSARFLLTDQNQRLISIAPTSIFLWDYREKICVVDVDGTITSSTFPAFLATVYLQDYTVCHRGVCQFLCQLVERAPCRLRLLYLTARPIAMADSTRKFLAQVRQDDHYLPEGALIGFRGTLAGVLKMDIGGTANTYKYKSLESCLLTPFYDIGFKDPACFLWGGIGNSTADEQAYRDAGVPPCRIFIIGKKSKIQSSKEKCTCSPRVIGSCKTALEFFAGYEDAAFLQYLLN